MTTPGDVIAIVGAYLFIVGPIIGLLGKLLTRGKKGFRG